MNKGFIYWFLSGLSLIMLAGMLSIIFGSSCNVSRRGMKSNELVHTKVDSSSNVDTEATRASMTNYEKKTVTDTIITIPEANASINLTPIDLLPATDAAGQKIGRDYRADNGSEHAVVKVDKAGNIHFSCHEDSLKMVIRNLVIDSIYQAQRFDSLRFRHAFERESITDSSSLIRQSGTNANGKMRWYQVWFNYIKNMLALVGAVIIIVFSIRFIIQKSVV